MNSNSVLESAFDRGQKYFQWLDNLHGPMDNPVVETVERACGVIWDRKGKRLRCHFVHWFSEPYQIEFQELELYTWAVEAIHTATLLHDDVIDRAEMRRGGASANQIFDNTIPILSGDYLMSDAIHQLAIKGHPDLMSGMCLALKELSQGEVLQYQNKFKIAFSEDFYRQVCNLKTASLLKWAASVGPVLRKKEDRALAVKFAEFYGMLYQFTDDILDIRGCQTKEQNQDLAEGKLNWAAWKMLEIAPDLKSSITNDFAHEKTSAGTLDQLKTVFNKTSTQKYLNHSLGLLRSECLKTAGLFEDTDLRQLLSTLVEFTLSRIY